MPKFTVQHPDGRTVVLEGDSAPTEQDLEQVFASIPSNKSSQQPASNGLERISKAIESVSPQQVGYEMAGGTAPGDLGMALGLKASGQQFNKGLNVAAQAEGMRNDAIEKSNLGPIGKLVTNIATDPMTYATLGGGGKATINKLVNIEGKLQKADRAKKGLDFLRKSLGEAKSLAIAEVKDAPTQLSLKGYPDKIMKAIQNPIYEVEFVPGGGLKQTVSNLDKVKEAIGELIHTPKIWEEAPSKELRVVKQIYGQVNNVMKQAANKAGKPIDTALDSYSKFMDNYNLVNKTLVDTSGTLQANKMRNAFRWSAEPSIKQAWKEVAKSSPEVSKVMKSMNQREVLSTLLKLGGAVGAGGFVAKKLLD